MDDTVYKIALAGLLHDIGKFAERGNMKVSADYLNDNADLYQPYYNNRHTHRHAVYTAAFIEFIQDLLPKEFNMAQWGLEDSFVNLTAGHHRPETRLQWIIAMADRISSGFDRSEFDEYNKGINVKDYKKTRLLTLFENIAPDGNFAKESLDQFDYRYPLKELSPEHIFPVRHSEDSAPGDEGASDEYSEHFENFISALKQLTHRNHVPLWFDHFDSLFMIYASHIPAATVGRVIPDVSLYDHSRTTAALAAALYLYHREDSTFTMSDVQDRTEKKLLLVTGDFYGIQDFIFASGGETNRASAKLLRGRSFAVSLLSELAGDYICRETGLPSSSIVLNAAGKFTLIAPNTKQTLSKISAAEKHINEWLMKHFYGETAMGVSFVEASGDDFVSETFGHLWERLSGQIEKRKFSKVDLDTYGGAVEEYLGNFNNELTENLCPFCGKRPSDATAEGDELLGDTSSACRICRDHIYIGTHLVKAQRFAITTPDAQLYGGGLLEPVFGRYQVSFDVTGELSSLAADGSLLKYWDIGISESGSITKDITAKFVNGYVPSYSEEDRTEEAVDRFLYGAKSDKKKNKLFDFLTSNKDQPKTFSHLSKMSLNKKDDGTFSGVEALGVLKADVDHLGLVFACGLKHPTLSRIATLSRQLNHYFTVYVPFYLKTTPLFSDVYTVFAGGDDLFLIGPWNRIIDLADHIHQSFKEFVCFNSAITLSAGISVNRPAEPVSALNERAETALKKAKNNNRNSITLFGESVSWDDFTELQELVGEIQSWIDKDFIGKSMLYKLNSFIDMAKKEQQLLEEQKQVLLEDWSCLRWKAQFKYNLARNVGRNLKGDEKAAAVSQVEQAGGWLMKHRGALRIPLWNILYNHR